MGWCGQTDISENGTSLIFQWFGPNFLTLACFLQCKQKGVSNTNTSEKITYSKRRGLSWKHLLHAAFLPDGILGIGWYCVCWPTKSLCKWLPCDYLKANLQKSIGVTSLSWIFTLFEDELQIRLYAVVSQTQYYQL